MAIIRGLGGRNVDHEAATGHLADWATGRIADLRLREEVSGHVASCEECAGIAAIAKEIEALVADQGASVLGRNDVLAAAEPGVRYEFSDAASGSRAVPRARSRRTAMAAAIAAAVLIVAVGIWGSRGWRTGRLDRPILISSVAGIPGVVRGPAESGELEVALDPGATEVPFVIGFEAREPVARLSITVRHAEDGGVVSTTEASNVVPERGIIWLEVRIPRRRLAPGPYVVSVTRGDPPRELVHRSLRILGDR